jgi:RNA polymerase sigma factor (sigma-70 family)
LLERFAAQRDPEAFRVLVERHGPLVLGVCRRWLFEPHDVEDAFQATFLVLVRRAGTLRDRDRLGPWLHGVAYRIARRTRAHAARRQAREEPWVDRPGAAPLSDADRRELRAVLDEEIDRLPEKYRGPVVLCYLEGQSCEETARRLGCPVGTVKVRLHRARERLRDRLVRRGLAPAAGLAAVDRAAEAATAAVPELLAETTIRAATTGAFPASAAALAQGVLTTMIRMRWLSLAATCLLVSSAMTAGLAAIAWAGGGDEPPARGKAAATTTKAATDSPLPGKEEAGKQSLDEQVVRAQTEIELLELDVEIMGREFQKAFAELQKYEAMERGSTVDALQQQLRQPMMSYASRQNSARLLGLQPNPPDADSLEQARKQLKNDWRRSLEQAREQFENDRRRYLEQRQRLRRLRAGAPAKPEKPRNEDGAAARSQHAELTSAEIGDRIEQAQVEEEHTTLEADELKARIRQLVEVVRGFQFQGESLQPGHAAFRAHGVQLEPTEERKKIAKEEVEAGLKELHKRQTEAETQYLKTKLERMQLAKRLEDLQKQYQKARHRERLERVVRVGDYLNLSNKSSMGPYYTGRVEEDGAVTLRGSMFPTAGQLIAQAKVAGLTSQQAKAAILDAMHQQGWFVDAVGNLAKGPPREPVHGNPDDLDMRAITLTIETPLEHAEAQRQMTSRQRDATAPAEIDRLIEALQKLKQSGGR